MKLFLIIFILLSGIAVSAQDNLKIMHYNLLYYGDNSFGCNSTNNNVNDKNDYLKTIVKYVNPDILTVNEISENEYYHQLLLNNALNTDDIEYFKKVNIPNYSNSNIVNMLYYNSNKLSLYSQSAISTNVRDIDILKLFYNSSDLSYSDDTAFIICIIAHLKSGQSSSDANERAAETLKLMNHLNNLNVLDNYIFMGDFNFYKSSEQAFQNLINYSNPDICFNDPINQIGKWHDNSYYSDYHTQSTHLSSNGCPSTGGMDDRFDFILISDKVLNGTEYVEYTQGSYKALGQDGQRFNSSLIASPVNTSVPANVLNALYEMSDHLPVIMDLKIDKPASINNFENTNFYKVFFKNPVKDQIILNLDIKKKSNINIEIISILGNTLFLKNYNNITGNFNLTIPLYNIQNGLYLLKISDKYNNSLIRKFIKI
ncbi:MAG: endonuclease/exonuclease/phosphatase family protein [Bacteroidales bacterium]|nr:endonuclease/exonuclease/phosphatase family protein [Bacteroidales bacterium]